jgi:hypothetical protein
VLALISLVAALSPISSVIEFPGAKEPQLALVDGSKIGLTFGAEDGLYFTSANVADLKFSEPVKIGSAGKLALGMRRGPRIASAGSKVVVSAVYGQQGKGQDGDLLAWTSDDKGRTWKGPSPISDDAGAAREGLHGMAASTSGRFGCAWLDLRNGKTEIWFSESKDGSTWSKNRMVYRSSTGSVCECCHPSVAYNGDTAYVMFRNSVSGFRDMYLASSQPDGSFLTATKLGTGTWQLNACPMDGGALSSAGGLRTVWRRDQTIYACEPGKPEVAIGEGVQAWRSGSGIVFLEKRNGRLIYENKGQKKVLSENANDPVIVGDPEVVAYEEAGRIVVARP